MKRGIVLYDITTSRYRTMISKKMMLYGERVQLSVFEFEISNREFIEMKNALKTIYKDYLTYCFSENKIQDMKKSIRIYLICEECMKKVCIMEPNMKKEEEVIII